MRVLGLLILLVCGGGCRVLIDPGSVERMPAREIRAMEPGRIALEAPDTGEAPYHIVNDFSGRQYLDPVAWARRMVDELRAALETHGVTVSVGGANRDESRRGVHVSRDRGKCEAYSNEAYGCQQLQPGSLATCRIFARWQTQ